MNFNDTIAAISTPCGTGGIGIVRISGDRAFDIGSKIFKGIKSFEKIATHTINYGRIIDPENGIIIDEVLLSKMIGPKTYTKENIVEINCHGGITVLKSILNLIIREGARPAEPGEFTKRAFLNGRIDLSQAEAVIDLINAKTAEGSQAAVSQLEGRLSESIGNARKLLIGLIAQIEVTVDYPEHDIEDITGQHVYNEVKSAIEKLSSIIEGFDKGRIIREGISAVIIGKPNVGKSSLLNALAGKSRAIVTEIPGTTRDVIEEYINIRGIPVKIFDTAGIRETNDLIEKIGVEKSQSTIETSDLAIMVLDAVTGIDAQDKDIIKRIEGKKAIYIINKMDLIDEKTVAATVEKLEGGSVIKASMMQGTGLPELENEIERLFIKGSINVNNEILVTNVRHKNLLDKTLENLNDACRAYEEKLPLDFITIDIKNAAEHLGQITGESVGEDVVKEIFSRFCVGK